MTIQSKEKCIVMAREITEAMITLEIALSPGSGAQENTEAKNVVAQVLRSYKIFIAAIPETDQNEVIGLFSKKIEAMAVRAKSLD